MPTLYDVAKKMGHRFPTKVLSEIGRCVIAKFRTLYPGLHPEKVRVDLKTKEGKEFHWNVMNYGDHFVPVMEQIIRESAHLAKPKPSDKKKRKRIQRPTFKARP